MTALQIFQQCILMGWKDSDHTQQSQAHYEDSLIAILGHKSSVTGPDAYQRWMQPFQHPALWLGDQCQVCSRRDSSLFRNKSLYT